MAETLRELVVRLSLESGSFSRNLRTINQQIKEAESTFKLAGAGIENFGSTVKGAEAKLQMLKSKLDMQKASVDQHSKALDNANKKLVSTKATYDQYVAKLDVAKAKMQQQGDAVGKAAVAYEHYRTTLGETDSATIAAKQNLEQARAEYTQTAEEVTKLDGQVAALSKQLQRNGDEVSRLQTGFNNAKAAMIETEREVNRLSSSWTQAGQALTNFSKKCGTISSSLSSVGRGLTTHVTAPLAALGAAATKAAIDFESAMAGVRKTLPLDAKNEAEAMSILSDRVQQLSLETASTAEEIAGVVEAAGQLGIAYGHNGDTLMDFAKTMIMLGDSTDMVAADAAKSAARFFNIMGTGADQYDNYGSAVTDLGNRFATTESEIVEMSMRLAGAGKQVGLSEAEILGFSTALSSVGIKAQMGGSAFSKALIKMEVAAQTGGKELQDFARISGMTADDFASLWKSDGGPAKAFQAFINGLSRMDDEGVSTIATLKDIGINEIRLRDTTLRLAANTDLVARAQQHANDAWNGADIPGHNALVNEATKRYQTMASKLTQLKNRAAMFARTVGNDLIPMMTSGMNIVQGLMEKFAGLDEGTRQMIEKFAIFAAALGPAILVVSKFIGTIGKVAGVAGTFATWIGKITTAVQGANTGLAALVAGINPVALGIAAATVAVVAGIAALYDYASGAKAAREAVKGLKEQADDWKNTAAQTFYTDAGVSSFGMSKSDFKTSTTDAQRWVNDVTRIWSDGEKKNKETISNWTNSYKELTDDTRTELKAMQDAAKESGDKGLSKQLGKDIKQLDSIDKQVANLLKKKANGKLTDKDKVKLENLIQQGDAIRLKYKLEPQGATNDGYEQLEKNLQAEIARLQASGGSEKQITDTYGKAAAAAAEGYSAIKDQLDENYRTRYQEIQLIDDETKKQAELNKLNEEYQKQREKAAQEYADMLKKTLGPVLESQGGKEQLKDVQELSSALTEYQRASESGDTNGMAEALQKIKDLNLDESKLTEYFTTLTQIQSLMDEGLVSKDQVDEMFPEADINSATASLANVQKILNALGEDPNLKNLKTMIGEALPEEIQKILVGLDMTQAAADWAAFANNPGAITTSAKIEKYEDAEAQKAINVSVQAAISEYVANSATKKPVPPKLAATITAYAKARGISTENLTPKDIEAIVKQYSLSPEAQAQDLNPDDVAVWVTEYLKDPDATVADIEGVVAYVGEYLEKDGGASIEDLTPENVTAIVNAYSAATGIPTWEIWPDVTAVVAAYKNKNDVTPPDGPDVTADVTLNKLQQTEIDTWKANNPVDAELKVTPSGTVKIEDLFGEGVVFHENGLTVGLTAEQKGAKLLTSDFVVGVDASGTKHVFLTPKLAPDAQKIEVEVAPKALTALALSQWKAANPISAELHLTVGQTVNSVEDLFDKENVKFYDGGVEVKLTPAQIANKVTLNDLVEVDADGTMHVIITPKLGTPEGDEATSGLMNANSGAGTMLDPLINSTQEKVDQIVSNYDLLTKAKEKYDEAMESGDYSEASNQQETVTNSLSALTGQVQELSDEDLQNVSLRVSQLMAALNSGEGSPEEMAAWKTELEKLLTFVEAVNPSQLTSTGQNIIAGIAGGMEGYDFSGSAADVKTQLMDAMKSAFVIGSPAKAMNPTGKFIVAGIGEGMGKYDLTNDVAVVAANLQLAFETAMTGELFTSAATPVMQALGSAFQAFNWSDTMDKVADKAKNALKTKLPSSKFKSIGENAMGGLAQGIRNGTATVVKELEAAAEKAVAAAKAKLKIESPSKVFRDEVGVMVMRGFGEGISKETDNQAKVITNAARYLTESAQAGVSRGTTNTDNSRTYNNSSNFNVYQTINGSSDTFTAQQREAARMFANAARRLM